MLLLSSKASGSNPAAARSVMGALSGRTIDRMFEYRSGDGYLSFAFLRFAVNQRSSKIPEVNPNARSLDMT
jgi:hypothetical protein